MTLLIDQQPCMPSDLSVVQGFKERGSPLSQLHAHQTKVRRSISISSSKVPPAIVVSLPLRWKPIYLYTMTEGHAAVRCRLLSKYGKRLKLMLSPCPGVLIGQCRNDASGRSINLNLAAAGANWCRNS